MKTFGWMLLLAGCVVAKSIRLEGVFWTVVTLALCSAGAYFILGDTVRTHGDS